jgi:HSP20 family protein
MTKEKAMSEIKEAPKPKTGNGQGQIKDVAPSTTSAPMKSIGSPFAFMRRFAEDMDHLFEEFGLESGWHIPSFVTRSRELFRRGSGLVPAEWSPKIDVLQREGQLVIRADLPGLGKEDVKVEVGDGVITIQGERKQEKKEERKGYCYSECSYGSFYRAIPLPEGAEAAKATAEFRKGVLEVIVPTITPPVAKAKRLEVREA